ncbi:MAG: 30S ribosome-binding factor RbfA [Bacteroidota bacterium]
MSIRTDRVGRMIQREVADLLQQDFGEASQSLVTVTGVRMTDDLGIAYVDVSVLGATPEQRQAAVARLDAQTVEIRHALAQRIRHQLRRIPELKFFLDEGPQRVERMDELFAQIAAERGADPTSGPDPEADEPGRGDY